MDTMQETLDNATAAVGEVDNGNLLTFQKGHITYLTMWLDVPVPASQNRHRNEFLKMIKPLHEETEEQRINIVKGLAELDEAGEVALDEKGQIKWKTPNGNQQAQKQYEELLQEPVNLVVTKPKALEFAKNFLSKITLSFRADDGIAYDEICEILGVEVAEESGNTSIAKASGIIVP